jgi:hypothetical protein
MYADKAATGASESDGVTIRRLGEDEMTDAHIERIFNLLVMQHPDYSNFRIQDRKWAWAQKISAPTRRLVIDETYSLRSLIMRALRRVSRALHGRG